MSLNIDSYIEVELFAKSIGANFSTSASFINNLDNNNSNVCLPFKKLVDFYFEKIKLDGKIRHNFKNSDLVCNKASLLTLSVSPSLDITPCNDFNLKLGNYNDISLSKAWNEVIPVFRKKFIRENLSECFSYEYCRYCYYCPKIAMYDAGFMKKSESCCNDAKAYYSAVKKYEKWLYDYGD